MIVCPTGLWPQTLMPWWVMGSQMLSSTTIGFQPTSHSKPEGVRTCGRAGVVRQLLVAGVLTDGQRQVEAELAHALVALGDVVW